MGRGCSLMLAVFAVAALFGYVFGWILFGDAPPAATSREGTWGIQVMFFAAPAAALAFAGAAAFVAGVLAVRGGSFAGAGTVGVAVVLVIPAMLAVYYGLLTGHDYLTAWRMIPQPEDPFIVSRRIAPLAAGGVAVAVVAWVLMRRKDE